MTAWFLNNTLLLPVLEHTVNSLFVVGAYTLLYKVFQWAFEENHVLLAILESCEQVLVVSVMFYLLTSFIKVLWPGLWPSLSSFLGKLRVNAPTILATLAL